MDADRCRTTGDGIYEQLPGLFLARDVDLPDEEILRRIEGAGPLSPAFCRVSGQLVMISGPIINVGSQVEIIGT